MVWGRGNLVIWEVFQTVATQFCYDFHQNPTAVLAAYGVPPARQPRILRLLARLYEIQQRNQEKVKNHGG